MLQLLLLVPLVGQDVSFEEKLLATIPEGISTTGPGLRGPDGNLWKTVYPIVWSPDGTQVAYVGLKGGQTHPIIGDEVGEPWQFLSSPDFGGSGEHVVFRAGRRTSDRTEEWYLLVDGEKIGRNAWIGEPAFAPDGETIAYWTQPNARIQKDGFYDRSGQVLCLARRKGKGWTISKGKQKWDDAMSLTRPSFTSDSKLAVTIAGDGGRWQVIGWGGRRVTEFSEGDVLVTGFALAPDGEGVAIVVSRGPRGVLPPGFEPPPGFAAGGSYVLHEGEAYGQAYDRADQPVFSEDARHLALRVKDGEKYGIAVGNEEVECLDDHVHGAVFDPGGRRLAYVANQGGKAPANHDRVPGEPGLVGGRTFVVVRNVKGDPELETTSAYAVIRDLVWSPRGDRLAFCAKDAEGWHVVVDGRAGPAFDDVGPPVFSRRGDQLAHGARAGDELWWKVRAVD